MSNEESKAPAAGDKPRLKTVTLKKEQKHRGKLKQPGEQIEVQPDQEERLKKHEVI